MLRFLVKIERAENGCWEWTGARKEGYGDFSANGKRILAHRYSYERFVGPIPAGLHIDHNCGNRICVNPRHLEAVTIEENGSRGAASSVRGHRTRTPARRAPEYNVVPTVIRFLYHVETVESGCWEWRGNIRNTGYGQFEVQGRTLRAHRWSYEHFRGRIPDGLQIDHLCKNKACVNPQHLEAVTAAINVERSDNAAALNSRKTHCKREHLLAGDNVRLRANGARICRTCERERNERSRTDKPEYWRTYHREYKRRTRAEAKLRRP